MSTMLRRTQHDSGGDRAYLYIAVANSKLWLDDQALDAGVVMGFDGWSEQCDDCGRDIAEHGKLVWKRSPGSLVIRCACGAEYMVRNHVTGFLVDRRPEGVAVDNRR